MKPYRTLIFALIVATMPVVSPVTAQARPLRVFVSILPQKYFVQQICMDRVDVEVMVQPGASPATYEPKPRQMVSLSTAEIYFAIGAPFERKWLDKIAAANPMMTIVATDADIEKTPMESHRHGVRGQDHHGGEHANAGLDPHIWTTPPLVKLQALRMLEALESADPANSGFYKRNCDHFLHILDQLHADLQEMFASRRGAAFLTFHPSWGYFARTYGLRQIAIEVEGKAPKPAQLQTLIKMARSERIKVIFVQPQFSGKSAELIAKAIGGRVVSADPLAPDWEANLRYQAEQFIAASR